MARARSRACAHAEWLEAKDKRLKIEEKVQSALQKSIAKELEWSRSNAKVSGGRAPGQGRGLSYTPARVYGLQCALNCSKTDSRHCGRAPGPRSWRAAARAPLPLATPPAARPAQYNNNNR